MVVAGDVPLYGGVDTIKSSRGLLAAAESRAARWYGADWCRFSPGGSTHGNQALSLAVGQPGDKVVVTRLLHRSLLLGMVLADLVPCWLPTTVDPATGMPLGVTVEDVESTLAANPDACAVLVTEPGYLGTLSDLAGIVEVAHSAGVPLVVDQAWGAHFGSHPHVPAHAMALGADAMVTSIHKLLPGYTQSSLVCARTERFDRDRLERAFEASHTTSPAGTVMASIDACRALVEARGPSCSSACSATSGPLASACVKSFRASRCQTSMPSRRVASTRRGSSCCCRGSEPTASKSTAGSSPRAFPSSSPTVTRCVPIVTLADDEATLGALVDALVPAIRATSGPPRPPSTALSWRVEPVNVMTPRAAFFAAHETVAR